MTNPKLTPKQLAAVRCIRASMAIEGYVQSEEHVLEVATKYYASGEDELIERLVEKARREGRSPREVFREHYGPPAAPKLPH